MHKFFRPFADLALGAVAIVGLSLAAPSAGAATILYQLDDSTDAIRGTAYNNGILKYDAPTCCDMITGTWFLSQAASGGNLTSDVDIKWNIYDPDGVTLSDTLSIVGKAGTNGLQIDFISDEWVGVPALAVLPGGQFVIETGTWQTALDAIALSNGDTFTFQFRSSETPLPAAVWLFGSVLAGAAGLRKWLRKHKGEPGLAAA